MGECDEIDAEKEIKHVKQDIHTHLYSQYMDTYNAAAHMYVYTYTCEIMGITDIVAPKALTIPICAVLLHAPDLHLSVYIATQFYPK